MLKGRLLSSCSHRTLNFLVPMGYDQYSAVQRHLSRLAFGYASAFAAGLRGASHDEAVAIAMRGMRTAYPGLDESSPVGNEPEQGSRSLSEALEG